MFEIDIEGEVEPVYMQEVQYDVVTDRAVHLDFLRMTGCYQYVSWDMQVLVSTGNGAVKWRASVPTGAAFVGLHFHAQFWARDPTANAAGLITSDAGLGILGN